MHIIAILLFPVRLILEPVVPFICWPLWSLTYQSSSTSVNHVGYWSFVGIFSKWWLTWHIS